MGTSLQNTKIKDTYEGLIKTTDNTSVGSSDKELTDGAGNDLNISVNNTGDITADGDVTAASLIKTGGTALQILLADGTVITLTRESDAIGSNDSDSNVPSNAAVKDYVDTEITNLIDSAPTALDTLNELAAALGDDANFSTTITTALGNRLRFDASQSLTSGEVTQALTNLGITATVAEINFIDGLTSNIQTQIDSKYDKTGGTISGDATITGDLTVDTSTLYVDSANNRVGIGTTSPDDGNLQIGDSNSTFNIALAGPRAKFGYDGANTIVQSGLTKGIAFCVNNATLSSGEAMRIDSSGNVGIGSSNPSGKFEVNLGSTFAYFTRTAGDNGSTDPAIAFGTDSTLTRMYSYGAGMTFWTGAVGGTASERLRIDSSGNVGIGETSIDAKLHLTTPTAGLVNQKFESAGSAAWRLGIPANQTYFAFDNSNDSLGSPKLVIDSSGNVGIGTTSPDSPLTIMAEVQASVPSAGESSSHIAIGKNNQYGTMIGTLGSGLGYIQQQRFDGAATTYDLLIQPNGGNVGIGETDPSRQLHVKGSTSTYVRIEANSSNNSAVEFADENDANVGRIQYEHLVDNMTFRVNDAEAMRIDSSGNVGIGTTSPNASGSRKTLHIEDSDGAAIRLADDGVSSLIRYDNTNGLSIGTVGSNNVVLSTSDTERMRINSSGNVGIGTTSPLVKTQISTNLSSGSVQDALLLSQNTATSSSGQGVKMYLSSSNSIIRAAAIEAIAGSSNDHSLGFYTNSAFAPPAERMRIDSSGNVGIGSSLSGGLLDKVIIKTGGQGVIKDALMLTTGDADNYAGTGVRINMSGVSEANSDIRHAYIEAATTTGNNDHYLAFATNSTGGDATERMRINSIGRVGIGTTSPSATLDVDGTGIFRDQLNIDPTGDPNNVLSLNARNSNDYANLIFRNSGGSANWAELVATPNTLAFETNSVERMRIDSSGQVKFNNYTSSSAFTGTAAANLAVDSSGNIITEAAAAVITWQSTAKTSSFTASSNEGYFVDTSSSAITITFPSAPSVGDLLAFTDYSSNFATNNVTLTSSKKILGADDDFLLDSNNQAIEMVFSGDTKGWLISSAANEGTEAVSAAPVEIDFLVVAGGGGGGRARVTIDSIMNISGGGGGAGEFLHLTGQEIELNENHNVTVGAGGAYETNGSDSRFLTTGNQSTSFDYTCSGGGYGGRRQLTGNDGGSGGGGAGTYSSSYTAGGDSVKNEAAFGSLGNDGGNGNHVNGARGAGGGGGAGAAGSNQSGGTGGDGGNGYASDITGTSVTYAGGGSGGGEGTANGTAGTGGGGAHSNGTANTGGGGGGASWNNSSGRSGGSGIVIIKYPDTLTLTVGSNLTSSTDTSVSGFKITTFTAGSDTISWS